MRAGAFTEHGKHFQVQLSFLGIFLHFLFIYFAVRIDQWFADTKLENSYAFLRDLACPVSV